ACSCRWARTQRPGDWERGARGPAHRPSSWQGPSLPATAMRGTPPTRATPFDATSTGSFGLVLSTAHAKRLTLHDRADQPGKPVVVLRESGHDSVDSWFIEIIQPSTQRIN